MDHGGGHEFDHKNRPLHVFANKNVAARSSSVVQNRVNHADILTR
jgi:hypothetical protein